MVVLKISYSLIFSVSNIASKKGIRIPMPKTSKMAPVNIPSKRIEQLLEFCNIHSDVGEVVLNTSAIAVITEWDEFKTYDWHSLKRKMIDPSIIFDGRNILKPNQFSSELMIKSIGKI